MLGDEFIGVEVKGQRDTLRRLSKQMEGYAACFDRTILVVANRHLRLIDRDALRGAALWSFDIEGNLTEVRPGGSPAVVSGRSYVEMMTQEERRRLLYGGSRSDPTEDIDRDAARSAFFDAFRSRYQQKSLEFWSATSRRVITASDLPLLSRFADQRNEMRRIAADRDDFWQRWADQSTSHET